MGNAVLVHGAWSDGSVWQQVVGHLHQQGHQALSVQLPMTSLADDIAWTRRHIDAMEGPLTLVGHSYGGTVISGAALDRPQADSLVFVAAYVPEEGETVGTLSDRGAEMPGRAALRFAADGWSHVDPALFGDALAHDLPPRLARSLAAAQKPTHAACLTAPAPRGAWHELPCGYVLSAEDRILDPRLQRWFAARAGAVVTELPSSHLSPLSHPGEVAAAISATLERAGGSANRSEADPPEEWIEAPRD
ncbi:MULTISPECIES: alpha/beta fold hydrolase [Streptomyces]|uniref:alpha/beta fold hydrolase n=1 Tax=Streptomyces TaxID=1883 RepID=UPI0019898176|nr:alpha/beta hydrolase [Streptomyces sp. ME02-6978.2a]MDX3358750.1 alpha/beta hydrolase [Streptomyces sp. ME02-6978.2a]GHE51108.1 alpha/beta hydrolase [Streptomyces griseoaurantiacus]